MRADQMPSKDNVNDDVLKPTAWQSMDTVPAEGHYLVWLDRPMLGCHIQVARGGKAPLIGSYFAWDSGRTPIAWQPLPDSYEAQP